MARQKCEVFSRSMGYIRPIKNFNIGKRAEFEERKTFRENIIFATIRKLLKK
jgi:ribonucleoside-triphosphate reductase